ncbi:hypothetical protein PPOLYM_03500 [Paenibacillus polymyxa]|uniref:helix-turn-helix domain-containing protein n=1 Tax=Paenibacillus TaxID=44249 RepID=UPI000D78217E|nr:MULTISPECIES: XRE family transcriptional regulator [Paenibacillus]MCP3808435.1 XRE family transcriptional regulator [Paenibacillus sp. Lou8.1]VUG07092.1 hypothetical protein PPOLYM_03500 [Paenibacillus polymyxa]
MQKYSELLANAIKKSGLKLDKICSLVGDITGNVLTKHYLSKLQNGKTSPASDKLNDALATVLGVNPIELKASAYYEKIPHEILDHLNSIAAKEVG